MDTRELKFPDETFDCVIDKGCLDTILVHFWRFNASAVTILCWIQGKCCLKSTEV